MVVQLLGYRGELNHSPEECPAWTYHFARVLELTNQGK